MSILPDQINLAEIAYLAFQAEEQLERESRIVKARELEAGYFDPTLAAETLEKALLGGSVDDIEGVNLIHIALNTLMRRINLQSVSSSDEELAVWLQRVFKANKLLKKQRKLQRGAVRDGAALLIVEYDQAAKRPWEPEATGLPKFYVHELFTSAEASYGGTNGSNEGFIPFYRNDDPTDTLEMVARRWVETTYENDEPVTVQRMTLYITGLYGKPPRVEKYKMDENGEWAQHSDETINVEGQVEQEPWPIWLSEDGTEAGPALPYPCFVFQNESDGPAFKQEWGIQSAMDQMWSAMLSGGTISGHPLMVALGFFPTTDGKDLADDNSNAMTSRPRQIIGTKRSKSDADVKQIEPADPRAILEVMDKIAIFFALGVGLPLKNFTFTRQVSSGEALRHGEVELLATANELTQLFEPEWIAAFEAARDLDNFYGDASWDVAAEITAQWAPFELVSTEVKSDEVKAKKLAAVPDEQIQKDTFGYSEEEVRANMANSNGAGETAVSEVVTSD
jgi:hypothetical protein